MTRSQVYIVSLYAKGERMASDCIGYFFATRSEARDAGEEYLELAKRDRENDPTLQAAMPLAWIHRYTIRKEWMS